MPCPSAADLKHAAQDFGGVYTVHREVAGIEHTCGADALNCDCLPLVMSFQQIHAHRMADLQATIDQHFRPQ